jgi:hypothetical protein
MADISIPNFVARHFPETVLKWLQDFIVETINAHTVNISSLDENKAGKISGETNNMLLLSTDGSYSDSGISVAEFQGILARQFGSVDEGNYFEIDADGFVHFYGLGKPAIDSIWQVSGSRIVSPSSYITYDIEEQTYVFDTACTLDDYVVSTIQLPRGLDFTQSVGLRMHWIQPETDVPNWLIEYRWLPVGEAIPATWSRLIIAQNYFTFSSSPIHQVSSFGELVPPDGVEEASLLQLRLYRDGNNSSGLFSGSDSATNDTSMLAWGRHLIMSELGAPVGEDDEI